MFDPRIVLRVSDDGKAVIALAAPGPGSLSPDLLRAMVDREGFGDYFIDDEAVSAFCRQVEAGKGPVSSVIAERRDGEVTVTVTASGDAAYLTVVPPYGGQPHSRTEIMTALARAGVKTGILNDVVERASRLIKADKILVAQALVPTAGEDARFVELVGPGSFVITETPLMRRTPATNGTPGETVTGLPIPPNPGVNLGWDGLAGCAPALHDPNTLVATEDGVVAFGPQGATVTVNNQIEVTVAPDGFGAFVSFSPAPGGQPPTREQLERALQRAGVRAGILADALAQASTLPATKNFLVAQAVLPQPGEPSKFVALVPEDTWVEPGAPLMRRLAPTTGKPGVKVTGEPLSAAQPGQEVPFYSGDGAWPDARSSDILRATHGGRVQFHERGATVIRACHVSVQVAPDAMVAYLTLKEGTGEAHRQRPLIDEALQEAGVVAGLLDEAIAEAAASTQVSGLLVARGEKPVSGVPGKLALLVDAQKRMVQAGTPLVRRSRAQAARPGFTVTGETVPPLVDGVAAEFDVRPGTMISPDDPDLIVAAVAGQILMGERWVEVTDVMQVATVTADSPIDSEDSVVVAGSVEPGGQVTSKGDIVVMGDVTAASIQAEGTVEIVGTISGNATIRAKGPVRIGELRDGSVESEGGVSVRSGITRGQVNAVGPVEVTEGAIVGGKVASLSGVTADVIGSADGEPTQIDVGPSPAWQLKLNKVKTAREQAQAKVDETSRNLIHLKIRGREHAHPKTMKLMEEHRAKLVAQVQDLDVDKERLMSHLSGKGPGKVVAKELVHPGVKVVFSDLAQSLHVVRTVESEIPGAVFSVRAGQIIAVPSVQKTIKPQDLPGGR